MEDNREHIIADDIELIEEQLILVEAERYNFAADLIMRMEKLGLSQSTLAARACVSHAAVGKWINRGAKPHGKERFKELGMALDMDEAQLNTFLQVNCYPKLYIKNPLDIACRFVLSASKGNEHIVRVYREFLKLYKLDGYVLSEDPANMSTSAMSRAFGQVKSIASLEAWIEENDRNFRAFDKSYIPHAELIRIVLIYIGEHSIHDLYIAGELPVTIKNMLYPLIADKEIAVKGFRAKLIVFGLYENMTENEINIMLETVHFQPLTETSARIDHVILTALRCAHERYPYFELNNAKKVLKRLAKDDAPELHIFYEEQRRRAKELVDYYEDSNNKSDMDRKFEQTYTDYAGRGILDYVKDILTVLADHGTLAQSEISEYMALMQTYQGGKNNGS